MVVMRANNSLAGIDLNLLVVLDAVLAERHVTRAALRLNKTQPAVSQAMARLRALLDDPLLVRRAGGLEPTARAQALAAPLGEALALLAGLLRDEVFSPETLRREFRVSMSDYSAEVLLPGLVRRLAQSAPDAALRLVSLGRGPRRRGSALARSIWRSASIRIWAGMTHSADLTSSTTISPVSSMRGRGFRRLWKTICPVLTWRWQPRRRTGARWTPP
ncbi:HTH-type transcriptional regulator LeuO [compost metagenome]